ncbi:MAG: cupin domain-containing protein [Burkholderiaceae bacterium]|jgi:quercetin dioxygenase-like cupin family protein
MISNRWKLYLVLLALGCSSFGKVGALEPPPGRVELKRADLSGAPGMEVISSITEFKPGEEVALHLHHGIETGYVVQGTMIQMPGKDPVMMETGASFINLRDVRHGGYKVVGDRPLKIFAVHVVDKGKPLYDTQP